MIDTPQIVQTAPQLTAFIHLTVPREKIREVMGPGLSEVRASLAAQSVTPAGPWFTHHLRVPKSTFDFEICIPTDRRIIPAGRVKPGQLPATTVAQTIYRGPYEGLAAAWGELESWIVANGYVSGSNLWERYVAGPESGSDPSLWQTELNRPVTKN